MQDVISILNISNFDELVGFLSSNQFFVALIGGTILASSLYLTKQLWYLAQHVFLTYFTIVIKVRSSEEAYPEISHWLSQQKELMTTRRLSLKCRWRDGKYVVFATVGEGRHFTIFRGIPIILDIDVIEPGAGGAATRALPEVLRMRFISRSRKVVDEFINEITTEAQTDDITVWTPSDGDWAKSRTKKPRSLDTVFISDDKKQRLLKDIHWFLDNENWYRHRGIPYHRTYMFEGPPGTGKTTLGFALASELKMHVYYLNLSSMYDGKHLIKLMSGIPAGAMLLMEDIDRAPTTHRKASENKTSTNDELVSAGLSETIGMPLGELLNALDSIVSPEGYIRVMTTNRIEKLDPALRRSGRMDVVMHIGLPKDSEIQAMFKSFYPASTHLEAQWLCHLLHEQFEHPLTADIQQLFTEHPFDHKELLERLENNSIQKKAS